MVRVSRLCNSINTLRILLLLYLTVITITCCVDYKHPSASELDQSKKYDIDILAIKPVDCAFSISGQYERTPRFICYLLLVFTVIIRNHEWLATVAAASVMTYSGVAAIHLIILFATNNRLNLPEEKSHCEYQPILGLRSSFVACAGVREPDATLAMILLLTLMLGALPVVAWSTTFEKSNAPRKAIFLCWLLLLLLGYTLGTLVVPTRGAHYQICLKDHIEPIATANFQIIALDQLWRNSFHSLVSRAQQSSQFQKNGSSPSCIYSCFATPGYIGRKTQDIHVYDLAPLQTDSAEVGLIRISIMWLYCLHTIFFLQHRVHQRLGVEMDTNWSKMDPTGTPNNQRCSLLHLHRLRRDAFW